MYEIQMKKSNWGEVEEGERKVKKNKMLKIKRKN